MLCNKTWREGGDDKVRRPGSAIVWATRGANRNTRGGEKADVATERKRGGVKSGDAAVTNAARSKAGVLL